MIDQVKNTDGSLTYGEKIMGLSFNPGKDEDVKNCKESFAIIADYLDQLRKESKSEEVKRMSSIAITQLQSAQMWTVKAITWED